MEVVAGARPGAQSVISQRRKCAESTISFPRSMIHQTASRPLDEAERHFGQGRVFAPIAGIISTGLADVANRCRGTPIAEILDRRHLRGWYIPNEASSIQVGERSLVAVRNRRIPAKIAQSCLSSGVYAGTTQQRLTRDRPGNAKIARIRFDRIIATAP